MLFRVATGEATPLLTFIDAWLAEGGSKGPLRERTKAQYRSDLNSLAAWAQGAGVPLLIREFRPQDGRPLYHGAPFGG